MLESRDYVDSLEKQKMSNTMPYNRRGMTLIELSIVTGIAALLLAMILGLSHHITTASNIRRAQTDLAAWHLAMDNWHNTFGEYPGDIYVDGVRDPNPPYNWEFNELTHLSNTYYNAAVRLNGATARFRSYCTMPVKIFDPWGTPYVYIRDENRQAYELFSCGPDADSESIELPAGNKRTHDTSLDDIRFER